MRAPAPRWLAGIVLTLAGVLTAGCDGYFVVIAVAPSSQVIVVDPTQKGGSIGGPKKETPPVPPGSYRFLDVPAGSPENLKEPEGT